MTFAFRDFYCWPMARATASAAAAADLSRRKKIFSRKISQKIASDNQMLRQREGICLWLANAKKMKMESGRHLATLHALQKPMRGPTGSLPLHDTISSSHLLFTAHYHRLQLGYGRWTHSFREESEKS